MFCLGRRVSVLQPPYVLLLSPRLSAGPAAGASALSRSVDQHLLFCASPRLCCLYGKECWLRCPAPPPLLRGQLRPLPLSRGLVLLLRVWPYLPLVQVWPVFGVRLPRRRPVLDPGGSHSVSALAFRHIALFVRPWLSDRARAAVASCGREWRWWELFGDSPLSPPRPVMQRCFAMAVALVPVPQCFYGLRLLPYLWQFSGCETMRFIRHDPLAAIICHACYPLCSIGALDAINFAVPVAFFVAFQCGFPISLLPLSLAVP